MESSRTSRIPIISMIDVEPTREALIDLHQLISRNTAFVESNFGGALHRNCALKIAAEEYMKQTSYALVPPYSSGDFPPTVGTTQEKGLENDFF